MTDFYHLSVTVIGRGKGRSAVACAAYRAGTVLHDERYGQTHDYRRRQGIEESGIALPEGAPAWMGDRERLWNAVEAAERRVDAQLAREFVVAFPHHLDEAARRELLVEFVESELTGRGLVADWAIHAPNRAGDERNWHAHIMTTLREATPEGFAATKNRDLNSTAQLLHWRERWAELQNDALAAHDVRDAAGRPLRVDHRSYEARGVTQSPTVHLGVHATAMERRGLPTELGDVNRARSLAAKIDPHRDLAEELERLRRASRPEGPSYAPGF